jgi:hypothetical protein
MRLGSIVLLAALCAGGLGAEESEPPRLKLSRISSPITVDGDLSDPGWKEATVVDVFYEINPGDNVVPPVKTVARIGYDDRFFYASFWCADPDPRKIRAPYVDRDGISDDQDYVGILLDVENQRHAAIDFWIGPTGIQADSVFNEGTFTEDFGPDYFWESAARIGSDAWTVEVAIPLSSLRYPAKNPQDWALMLYRIYPRDFNHQLYSVRVPQGANCFLCQSATVQGITGLPRAAHLVVAPYASASSTRTYPGADGYSGDGLVTKGKIGADAKWLPNAGTVVDATINPDFSQVESDVAQISANERFALFYPEKRPFFLEHLDLLQMPIQAVYTRTITSPLWGGRLTGKTGGTNFTILAGEDRGGGTVIIPGPVFSDSAPQDFHSFVGVARVRQDLGPSFGGLLATGRAIEGGGYNVVGGGDFQWRPNVADVVTGQYLYSVTRNPDRPDLYAGWLGQRLSGFGATAQWSHSTQHWNWLLSYIDFSPGFRDDEGFVPQVGYRDGAANLSYRFVTTGFFSRVRPLVNAAYTADRDGSLLSRTYGPGVSFQARYALRGTLLYDFDAVRIDGQTLLFDHFTWNLTASPSRWVPNVTLSGDYGEQADVDNLRVGTGGTLQVSALVRPTAHLGLDLRAERRWIDETVNGISGRLFTADVARVKATYVFNARMLVRLIGQYVETTRDPTLWTSPVAAKDGAFSASALFSYKLNWQTVLFAGYGDNRTLQEDGVLMRADRQFFLKVSYAFQR